MKKGIFIIMLFLFLCMVAVMPLFGSQRAEQTALQLQKRGMHPLLITGLLSLLPVFELRGGIPIGIALFKQNIFLVYGVAVIFNCIPVLPILYLLIPLRRFLLRHGILEGFFLFLSRRVQSNKKIVERYEEFGLILFVAIPLPITGAWTGSLIAASLGLKPLKSFLFIALGVLSAGILVTLLTLLGMRGIVIVGIISALLCALLVIMLLKRR